MTEREKIKELENVKDIDKGTIYKYVGNDTWYITHPIKEFDNKSFINFKLLQNFVLKNKLINTLDKEAREQLN